MGSGRTDGGVVGDVWRKEHSSVGAGAPVWELRRGGILTPTSPHARFLPYSRYKDESVPNTQLPL